MISTERFCVSGSPKTATTTVRYIFKRIFEANNIYVHKHEGLIRHSILPCDFLFSCVRNPYDQVKSGYRYFKRFDDPNKKPIIPVALEGWDKFSKTWDGNWGNNCTANNFVEMGDYYIRTENIREDVERICREFDLVIPSDLEFPHLLKGRKERLVLTPDRKKAIKKNFNKVFELYYQFEIGNPQGNPNAQAERNKRSTIKS